MLHRIFLFTIFFITFNSYALDDIDSMLDSMGREVGIGATSAKVNPPTVPTSVVPAPVTPVPTPAPTTAAASVPATTLSVKPEPQKIKSKGTQKAKNKEEDDGVPEYHFAYTPDDDYARESNYSKSTPAGRPGNLVLNFYAEDILYKGTNVGRLGFGGELGWQINIFKYLSVLLAAGGGYRKGVNDGDKLYLATAKGALRGRLLSWLYPFIEIGTECTKIANVGWQRPSKAYGGGFLIRLGAADKKAEFEMYRTTHIQRMILMLGFDYVKVPQGSALTDAYVGRGGLSLEF